jgi:uncharacterized protein YjiS (DUF1127 family)
MSTFSKNPIACDHAAHLEVRRCSHIPTNFVWHGAAGNDATHEAQVLTGDPVESLDGNAVVPCTLDNIAATHIAASARPASYAMYHAARTHRALILCGFFVAAIRAVGVIARRIVAGRRQHRRAVIVSEELQRLDDETLRDLSLDRSELTSLAAEVTGVAERTRVRANALRS